MEEMLEAFIRNEAPANAKRVAKVLESVAGDKSVSSRKPEELRTWIWLTAILSNLLDFLAKLFIWLRHIIHFLYC